MTPADIPSVLEIDHLSFPIPWSERTYRLELKKNRAAHLLIAETGACDEKRVIGYVGFWYVIDEAHISTLAVHPDYRGKGVGENLLIAALKEAVSLGCSIATLEVRASNKIAVSLYQKFDFEIVGRRAGYYRDNREDAILMALNGLNQSPFVADGGEE
jgi:ribosomal-protein-alanine N-acetyltransferase